MRKTLIAIFAALITTAPFAQQRTLTADLAKVKAKTNTMFNECIGAGRANEGLRADWQQQLASVQKDCNFKYIRFHGLLTDDMGVYREDKNGNPEYNYQYIDVLFDYLLSINIKPFVELGFMPEALASGKKHIFWWRGNVTPPRDYNKWEGLIRNLTQHFTDRYGVDEVKTWYFEVWNEPNLSPGFWSGTQDEYFQLYKHTAAAVKSVNPDYKVGGPATAGAAWVPETLDYCKKNNIAIDFISTHSYGVKQGFLDEFGNSGTVLNKEEMSVSGDVINSRKQISESAFPNLELHYTEWSSSYTPADPMHDSYHQAAYILQKIKQVGTAANSMSYWVFTDIFEESGVRFTPFHGGFGLLNTQGIAKPAYFAYKYMNQLGDTELENSDANSWICKDNEGNVQILAWDFSNTHPGDSVNNQVYYIRDLPAKDKGKLQIDIKGLLKGKYTVTVYKTGYRSNDVYTAYLDMKKPANLTKQQVAELKAVSSDKAVYTETIKIKNQQAYTKQLDIRENDVYLIKISKLK